MPSKPEKEIFLTLINKYKEMTYLWQKNHKYYRNKNRRDGGYDILLGIYKEFDRSADLKILKKKIENMRTSYVKEFKKVVASKQTDSLYIPSLWYYDALSFLESQTEISCGVTATDPLENELQASSWDDEDASVANSSNSQEKKNKQENILSSTKKIVALTDEESEDHTGHRMVMYLQTPSSDDEAASDVNSTSRRQKRKKKETLLSNQNKIILSTDKIMVQKEEEWEVYGRSIGFQIKDLDKRQLTIAQKLISDVIFYAKLDQLSESSYVVRNPTNNGFHRHQNQTYKVSSPSNCSSPSPSH